MALLVLILYALGLRAFLFEIKFGYIRHILRQKHELFEIFLDCHFCNGFWCGAFIYLVFVGLNFEIIFFALTVGFLAYLINILIKKLKDEVLN